MFWGSMSYNGVGDLVPVDGSMNQHQYLRILNECAFPSGDRLIGEAFILQQDNAPCHKSRMITKCLAEIGVQTLDWPPQSPDLNVIENVWSYIKRYRSTDLTRTRDETITEITNAWNEISEEFLHSLVDSVLTRFFINVNNCNQFFFSLKFYRFLYILCKNMSKYLCHILNSHIFSFNYKN